MGTLVVFYDGCHKLYYAKPHELDTIAEMRELGYETITVSDTMYLYDLWDKSCSLRFISPASLDDTLPRLRQGDYDFDTFLSDLHDWGY